MEEGEEDEEEERVKDFLNFMLIGSL